MHQGTVIALLILTMSSCMSYTNSAHKMSYNLFPVKDKNDPNSADTSRYLKKSFDIQTYQKGQGAIDGKRVIVPLKGKELQYLADTKERYLVYFWNPECAASSGKVAELDSMTASGENVLLVSLRSAYGKMDMQLRKTNLSRYPLYVIEEKSYTKKLLLRQLSFINEGCPACYEKYRGDLLFVKYLLIENGEVKPVFYASPADTNK